MSIESSSTSSLSILADSNIPAVEHFAGSNISVQRFEGRALSPAQLKDVNVLLVRSVTTVDETLLKDANLAFVGTATSGFEHIDRDYLQRRGIGFAYAPGSNANSVVEYVIAAIANVGEHLERLTAGEDLGIIGYGVIGKALATRMSALGVSCRFYDPWLPPSDLKHAASLDDVLACSVISVHAELTTQQPWPSQHLLSERELNAISRESLLINASRGAVIDNQALKRRLQEQSSPSVVLDVWEGEPAIDGELLQHVKLGTPHIAGYSTDGKLLGTKMLLQALKKCLGQPWIDPGKPITDPPLLALRDDLSKAATVRSLIQQRYDIRQDDGELREATLGKASDKAARSFDQLRRRYPERRELLGSKLRATQSLSEGTYQIAMAMGVELTVDDS